MQKPAKATRAGRLNQPKREAILTGHIPIKEAPIALKNPYMKNLK